MKDRGFVLQRLLILVVVPAVLYVCLLPVMPLMEPDESRYALIPQYMNSSADYVTPHLKGVVYLEKPPLVYWATALAFVVFGENEFSARLFSALCAWGCILLVYAMGTWFHDRKTGLYSAAVLSTCVLPFALGRVNILDMPLAFFVSMAVWAGFRSVETRQRQKKGWLCLMYTGAALAFLTKGLIGVVFPFAILVAWLLWSRRWADIPRLISMPGAALFCAVAGPWLFLVQQANPDFFSFFFIQEHLLRYTTSMHERTEPIHYYLWIILAGTLPWWPYLFRAIWGIRAGLQPASPGELFHRPALSFCICWAGFIFFLFFLPWPS